MSQLSSQLDSLGWDQHFAEKFKRLALEGAVPARVLADHGADYLVHDGVEAVRARARSTDPAVGDWVALTDGVIHAVVERRTAFSRRAAGTETREQILAANVDVAFVIAAATDVNVRRIERYLTIAWQSGASPVIVLTKSDLGDSDSMRVELGAAAPGTPVIVTSSITGQGLAEISGLLQPALTGVLLGPSGVGKSTLINRLAGEVLMRTREIHRSGEGRHMTSHRQLFLLPEGGMIIDTPGLREAQLWQGEDALGSVFEDIEALSQQCRFNDCRHETEPGCAVRHAVNPGRLRGYRKLQRELRAVAAKSDARIRAEDRKKWRQITMAMRTKSRP